MNRDLYISLVFGGGEPEIAYLHDPSHTIEDYEAALPTVDYITFAKEIGERFILNADMRLMGNLYRAEQAMLSVGPEHASYSRIQRNYIDLLRLTTPIVERLQKIKAEVSTFEGLELCIRGIE